MAQPKGNIERLEALAAAVPNYPGRSKAESAVRPVVEPWARRYSVQIVHRLLGYWLMWQLCPGGRKEIMQRGWMSRPRVYATEADFVRVFGVPVEEFRADMIEPFFLSDPTITPEAAQ